MEHRYPKPVVVQVDHSRLWTTLRRLVRTLYAIAPLVLGAAVLWQEGRVRVVEATVAQHWLDTVLDGPVEQMQDIVTFPWVDGPIIGMQVTAQCTVAYLIGPMCLLAALLTILTKAPLHRVTIGLAVGSALLMVVNQARIALIAVSTQTWGISGYDLTHKLIGTLIALIGFSLAALTMVMIAAGHRGGSPGHRVAGAAA